MSAYLKVAWTYEQHQNWTLNSVQYSIVMSNTTRQPNNKTEQIITNVMYQDLIIKVVLKYSFDIGAGDMHCY